MAGVGKVQVLCLGLRDGGVRGLQGSSLLVQGRPQLVQAAQGLRLLRLLLSLLVFSAGGWLTLGGGLLSLLAGLR